LDQNLPETKQASSFCPTVRGVKKKVFFIKIGARRAKAKEEKLLKPAMLSGYKFEEKVSTCYQTVSDIKLRGLIM
jgi:hypothetical protein